MQVATAKDVRLNVYGCSTYEFKTWVSSPAPEGATTWLEVSSDP